MGAILKPCLKIDIMPCIGGYIVALTRLAVKPSNSLKAEFSFSVSIINYGSFKVKAVSQTERYGHHPFYLFIAFADDSGSAVITESQGFNRSEFSLTSSTFASFSSCVPSSG